MPTDTADAPREHDQFIPIRKSDLAAALGAETSDADAFRRFSQMIGALMHLRYFDELEDLRDAYYHFNPDLPRAAAPDPAALTSAYDGLVRTLTGVLTDAEFVAVPRQEVDEAHRERHILQVAIDIPTDLFRDVKIFRRGRHRDIQVHDIWFGLRHRQAEVEVFDHVVLMVTIKPEAELGARQIARLEGMRLRPGAIMIKYFRDIARGDIVMLFPGVRAVMSLFDKLVIGVPALAGGIPLIVNLLPTLSVLFLVIGFYLGLSGAIEDDHLKKALAALSGLVALGGFVMRQWLKYQRQSLKYHKEISDNVYFRNINNNAGLFDAVVGAAEAEEWKKTVLAYVFLANRPAAKPELDAAIERWLKERFGVDVDFDVTDALERLEELRLLRRDGERLAVPPLVEALAALDNAWTEVFAAEPRSASVDP